MNVEFVKSVLDIINLKTGKLSNGPVVNRKVKQILKILKLKKTKRKRRGKKKKKNASSSIKVKKSKMNKTQGESDHKKISKPIIQLSGISSETVIPSTSKAPATNVCEYDQNICWSTEASPTSYKVSQQDNSVKNIIKSLSKKTKITKTGRYSPKKDQKGTCSANRNEVILLDELEEESFGEIETKCTELSSSSESQMDIDPITKCFEETNSANLMNNSELLNYLFKKLIYCEIEKQTKLEEGSLKKDQKFVKLFSESDLEILKKFFKLSNSASSLFVRMLVRKKTWHRATSIKYQEIGHNLEDIFEELHREKYIDINIENKPIKMQVKLLSKTELQKLCKKFNVSLKKFPTNKKENYINALFQEITRQRSVLDMSNGEPGTRINALKSELKKILGMCVKLNENTVETFYKVLLLNSLAYYTDEEEKRFSNVLYTHFLEHKKERVFPNYKVCPTVIFETQTDFEEYIKALQLYNFCEISIKNKNFEEFVPVCMKAKAEFERLLNDNEYKKRFSNLKSFLQKFTAVGIYARILTNYCTKFQKKVDKEEVVKICKLLLQQNLFLIRKKGEWYEILSKTLKQKKKNIEAGQVIIQALLDPHVTDVMKVGLQIRGQLILNKQTHGIKDIELRQKLSSLCILSLSEPASTEFSGLAVEGTQPGHKIIYKQNCQNGLVYKTVEELVLSYYKTKGYTKGCHSEGLILQSVYFLLFFDIIYGLSPEGVFQSPYQTAPLDFNSSSFYENRKKEIDILLSDMCDWDDKELEKKIRHAYSKNYGTFCLINWERLLTVDNLCELIKCITVQKLVCIIKRFVKNFREVQAGFPDLTLWNPETKKCIFVEVKSPSDKLSLAQKIWLEFLKNVPLNCEVCNVKNVSGKSFG